AVEDPLLYLTHNGLTLQEILLDQPRLLVGRSEHNDLSINSRYVSRHHALFIRHGDATFLMDLNSTNGTYVNSRRVSNHVMANEDIVTIGSHRIKFVHAAADNRADLNGQSFDDTVVMKSLGDLRRMLARENTQTLPLEEIGTLGPTEKAG
ncbi:MAG: FHA domain-containing protein, partial [Gammaproteobacteria bacterium]|nr:FHA domain-containing protein [Gammaproteobacteria bacterium]